MSKSEENNLVELLLGLLNEEKYASKERKEISRNIKKFIDQIPGGFVIYREGGNEEILYANHAVVQMFGCDDLSEFMSLTGGSFRGIVHPDDFEGVEKSIEEQIYDSEHDLDYVEYRIVKKGGEVRWVEDYGHIIRNAKGNVFYVFITDATEKISNRIKEKQEKEQTFKNIIEEYDKERKLIRQEHLQRLQVIEGLSVNYESILYADLDMNTVLAYRVSSRFQGQFMEKLQQDNFARVMKTYTETFVHPDDRAYYSECAQADYIRRRLAEESTYYINYRCIEKGEVKYLQMRIVDVGETQGNKIVLGYRCVDDEVLEGVKRRKILEDALAAARAAEIAKNSFLSNMSHDMRTPLNAIFGYLALARKSVSDPDAVAEYLDKIEHAGKSILELVVKVLEFSYTESSEASLNEEECSLGALLAEVYADLAPRAEAKKITVSLDAKGVKHDAVSADVEKLKQTLTYIANNAVKYTKNGGRVEITAYEKERTSAEIATYVFTVKDNGIGISEEALPRIFEPFEREQNTTLSGEYGLGLGLTIVKHFVTLMGGSVNAESKLGEGSAFTVTLSLKIKEDEKSDADKTEFAGKRILIVEDNEINREIEAELLQDLGFTVDTAENGKIAVDKVAADREGYSLVLMDIQMPVLDGIGAAKAIRALPDERAARVPIIALSANAFESDRRASLDAGMNAHLSKPLDVAQFVKTVAKIFGGP